jgi:hypothetical protein
VGSGPYGGTGSDLVCDRELLISSLRARPDRLEEWARVLGITPEMGPVARYIRKLRPVTLTQDTRVTNHSFVDGRAVGYQAILQAGTAVLVDENGEPVARCRCGNPLLKPVFIKTAKCLGCPPNYKPPSGCPYGSDECYRLYPNPPKVKRTRRKTPPPTSAATNPSASFSPSSGTPQDTYTLSASGFRPNVQLSVRLTRPDGASETYGITTDGSGSGSYTFPRVSDAISGTYTATVTDQGSGDSATASTTVRATGANPGESPDQQAPDPNFDCPDQPPASPGEDYLRNCPANP